MDDVKQYTTFEAKSQVIGQYMLGVANVLQTAKLDFVVEVKTGKPNLEILIPEDEVAARIKDIAAQITVDYEGKNLLMVGILKGAVVMLTDLMMEVELDDFEIDFMAVSSYQNGTVSSGEPQITKDLSTPIEGRHVLIVEDIADTGYSLETLLAILAARNPASLRTCVMLSKPDRREVDVPIDYLGFEIPDKWVEGRGIDTAQKGRGGRHIYARVPQEDNQDSEL